MQNNQSSRFYFFIFLCILALSSIGCAQQTPQTQLDVTQKNEAAKTAEQKAAEEAQWGKEMKEKMVQWEKEDAERKKTHYPFGTCGSFFRNLKKGQAGWAGELRGFCTQDKAGQYWIFNLDNYAEGVKKEKDQTKYQVLALYYHSARELGQFEGLPRKCVKKENFLTLQQIKELTKKQLQKESYEKLLVALQKMEVS